MIAYFDCFSGASGDMILGALVDSGWTGLQAALDALGVPGWTLAAAKVVKRGIATVADGFNADDVGDWRPGMKAARERGVRSPLKEAQLAKADIRELSHRFGLPTWDKPAMACLSSRIPYGQRVTVDKLSRIDGAERFLRGLGFRILRVRHHENHASVEVGQDELPRALELADQITAGLLRLGFGAVSIDPQGYRSGSLNAALKL